MQGTVGKHDAGSANWAAEQVKRVVLLGAAQLPSGWKRQLELFTRLKYVFNY